MKVLRIYGTPVVSGMAYAPALWAAHPGMPPEDAPSLDVGARQGQFRQYEAASRAVSGRFATRAEGEDGHTFDVLTMLAGLARDRGLSKEVERLISQGMPALQAVIKATEKYVAALRRAGGLTAERAADLRDIRNRILAELQGLPEPGIPTTKEPSILLADDLSPADTVGLDTDKILAIATVLGGPTSHTAIVARQMGIPCIVAARQLGGISAGDMVLFDGSMGALTVNPDPEAAMADVARDRAWRHSAHDWKGPARTRDGHRVEILANVRNLDEARKAAQSGTAEGIGMVRTEMSFLNARVEPSVAEQTELYRPIFETFPRSKVVFRTLDAGSDKPLAFANLMVEDNPALGVRGVRIDGLHPEIMKHQLDAIAAAASGHEGSAWVMAPMIATLAEAEWFARSVRERGLTAGIMAEVPSVAILIEQFLERVDFVSIGTNDLSQYTMAADRLSPNLAEYNDPWQPAVLALIARTARAGVKMGKTVCVCGEAAADPLLACVLVGMGVVSLSIAPPAIPIVGAQLAAVSLQTCRDAAQAVASARDGMHARGLARQAVGV